VLPGSCHPRATPSGDRVLRASGGGLDQLVQSGGDGGVPPGHDMLITQGGGRGGIHHQLPGAGARCNRQGRGDGSERPRPKPASGVYIDW
jgi:hypothetical protein